MNQGWECPRCHVIHAPHVDKCLCAPATQPQPSIPPLSAYQCGVCGGWVIPGMMHQCPNKVVVSDPYGSTTSSPPLGMPINEAVAMHKEIVDRTLERSVN